jgi:molecular chaperone HscB
LPRRYRIDPANLDRSYRALQHQIHPDRHAGADEAQRRVAEQASARVNEAYRTLQDPVARASYLLSLHGLDPLAETNTSLPREFLEHELERRESVAEAHERRDSSRLYQLLSEVRNDASALQSRLADHLDGEAWDEAHDCVRELKFLAKIGDDIEAALSEVEG